MAEAQAEQQPDSWRVVLLTDFGGQIVHGMRQILEGYGHKLVGLVTSPGPRGLGHGRHLDVVAAAPRGVDVFVSNHPKRWAAMLAPLQPDLVISAVFPWIIPDELIALPRLGAVNMHGGLLPRWRGPNAFAWAFRAGDGEIGPTVHRLASGLDTGPILATAAVPYGDDDDMEVLVPKLAERLPAVWAAALPRIAAGDPGDVQDESRAGYAPIFDEAYRAIDWSKPAREIHNQARAWMAVGRGATPAAVGVIDGAPTRVLKTRLAGAGDPNAAPGTVLSRDGDEVTIQCGDAALRVLRHEPVEVDADGKG
jgi:methionyl-tRNA formyltransferase